MEIEIAPSNLILAIFVEVMYVGFVILQIGIICREFCLIHRRAAERRVVLEAMALNARPIGV